MIRAFLSGLTAYPKAHRLIVRHRLWAYLLIPGIFSVLYVCGLIVFASAYYDDFAGYISTNWLPAFMQGQFMFIVTTILLWILWLLVCYTSYKHIALMVLAPLLGFLSEKVEKIVAGEEPPPFSFRSFVQDFLRGMVINFRNLGMTVLLSIPAWLLIFIPAAGAIASAALLFAIQAYYGGFGLMDYTLERKRYRVKGSVAFIKSNRGSVIGVGSGFMLLMLVPLIGWFAAPVYGTIAATLTVLDRLAGTDRV